MTRIQRITRIVDLRGRALEAAQRELEAAVRRTEEARADAERAEQILRTAEIEVARFAAGAADDFATARTHLITLSLQFHRAQARLGRATDDEGEKRRMLSEAKREVRKVELWRDSALGAQAEEEARRERRATDELAARRARKA